MKRIAIPINNGEMCEYFCQCAQYRIYEQQGEVLTSRLIAAPKVKDVTSMPLWIADQGITDVLTYKIDGRIMDLFAHYKINLYIGVKCTSADEIIERYMNGKLRSDERIISEINKNRLG